MVLILIRNILENNVLNFFNKYLFEQLLILTKCLLNVNVYSCIYLIQETLIRFNQMYHFLLSKYVFTVNV